MEQNAKMRLVTPQRTPRLRFPGFSGEWERKTLEEIGIINPSNNGLPEKFYYIDLESVNKGIAKNLKFMNKETAPSRAQRILQKNDILFQTVRPYQQNNYLFQVIKEYPVVASTGYAQIRCKQNNPRFIYQALHQKSFLQKVLVRCTGGTYPAINSGDLKEIKITIPSLPEQEKIADFFTALDEKIDAKEKEIEEVKTLKKGFLQQLFPQEGETEPRLRFPGFSGAWEFGKIGDFCSEIKETINPQQNPNERYREYSMPAYDNKKNPNEVYGQTIKSSRKIINTSCLLINKLNVRKKRIWLVIEPTPNSVCSTEFIPIQSTQINLYFLNNVVSTDVFTKYLENNSSGTSNSQKRVEPKTIMQAHILIPSLPEQEKIADFFSALDEKIEAMEKQRDALKAMKKGFLQQMFI